MRADMASGRASLKSLQYTQNRSSPPTFTGSNFFIAYLCPTTRSEMVLYCALLISCTVFCKSTSEVIFDLIFIKEKLLFDIRHEFAENPYRQGFAGNMVGEAV